LHTCFAMFTFCFHVDESAVALVGT